MHAYALYIFLVSVQYNLIGLDKFALLVLIELHALVPLFHNHPLRIVLNVISMNPHVLEHDSTRRCERVWAIFENQECTVEMSWTHILSMRRSITAGGSELCQREWKTLHHICTGTGSITGCSFRSPGLACNGSICSSLFWQFMCRKQAPCPLGYAHLLTASSPSRTTNHFHSWCII